MHDINLCESYTDELLHPQIVTPLPLSVKQKAGSELHLLCLLTGYPPMEIEWYLDGEVISPSDDARISMSNNQRELIIKNLTNNDCGSIMFRAMNKYGEVTSTCLLNVTSSNKKKKTTHCKNASKLLSSPSMRNKLNKVFFGKSPKV